MSGPVAGLFGALLGEMSGKNEFSVFISDAQRQRILAGLFANYYADSPAQVIIDTHRSWCTRLPALKTLFPQSRVIACVRNVAWIMDSIEHLVRHNAFQPSSIFNYLPGGTVYTRVNTVCRSSQHYLIGIGPISRCPQSFSSHCNIGRNNHESNLSFGF